MIFKRVCLGQKFRAGIFGMSLTAEKKKKIDGNLSTFWNRPTAKERGFNRKIITPRQCGVYDLTEEIRRISRSYIFPIPLKTDSHFYSCNG